MAYYHVLVKFRSEPKKILCLFSDLTKRELKAKFLKPYRAGHSTLAGSDVIEMKEVVWTQIIETVRNSNDERKDVHDKSVREIEEINRKSTGLVFVGIGRGYAAEDIAEAGKDVTSVYIKTPPGHDKSKSVFKIMNNPWVVRIGCGLLVAGILAWLR